MVMLPLMETEEEFSGYRLCSIKQVLHIISLYFTEFLVHGTYSVWCKYSVYVLEMHTSLEDTGEEKREAFTEKLKYLFSLNVFD